MDQATNMVSDQATSSGRPKRNIRAPKPVYEPDDFRAEDDDEDDDDDMDLDDDETDPLASDIGSETGEELDAMSEIEDDEDEDEELSDDEEDEYYGLERTKAGYAKDDFVVDDDEDEEDYSDGSWDSDELDSDEDDDDECSQCGSDGTCSVCRDLDVESEEEDD